MGPTAVPNFDPLALARQVVDLNAEFNRELREGNYERAAVLRDQRQALLRQLDESGNSTIAQNIKIASGSGLDSTPVLTLLENVTSAVDPDLLQHLNTVRLPPRWVLSGRATSCRATMAKLLDIGSLESSYFRAKLPVLGRATLAKASHPIEWITAAIREASRATSPVVWIVQEPAYLAERGLLDIVLQVLQVGSTQFVACLADADEAFARQLTEIPGALAIRA